MSSNIVGQQLARDVETLRDRFAMAALQSMNWYHSPRAEVAQGCYAMADAMLKERGEQEVIPPIQIVHGVNCPKVLHNLSMSGGHLHSESDDAPYDVDGVSYCGRCHAAL